MRLPPPKQPRSDDEIARLLVDDPRYWIEHCLYIVDQNQRRVPFLFNGVQVEYYERRSPLDIIVKSRKMGFSSVILAIILHQCVFQQHTRAAVISHDEEATVKLLRRVRDYIEHSAMPIRTKTLSATEISFPDSESWLYIGTAGRRAFGRGGD